MIRLVLSNRKTKNIVALLLTAIMIFQLFSSVDWVMVAEAATPDTYTIEGTIGYSGDDDWKDAIRPLTFDCSKIKLDIYNTNGNIIDKKTLQDTNADGEFHLKFIHDGEGGGSFTISNIPKTLSSNTLGKCVITVNGVSLYENTQSEDITFDETTGLGITRANVVLQADTVPLNIRTKVIGEGDETSTAFDVAVKVTNSTVTNIKSTTKTNIYSVSKALSTGRIINVPVGLQCEISQNVKAGYTLVSYNLSYEHSGGELNLQPDSKSLNPFKLNSVQASNTVQQYNVFIQNAAQNKKVEWKVNWIDNYSSNRPSDPTFKLQYSLDNSTFSDVTTNNIASLGLTSVPQYTKVTGETSKNDNIQSFYYENLPNTDIDGKKIYYKVVQTTNSTDYIYEYDDSTHTFYNTLKTNFKATIKWLDSDEKISTVRPTIEQIKGYMHLYSYTDMVYSEVSLSTSDINITENADSKRQWDLEITKGLPQYDKNNNKITYVLVEGKLDRNGQVTEEIETIVKNGYTGEDKYKVSYYNKGGTEADSDRCYAEQLIIHTSSSKYKFSATKIWKDDSNVVRPTTRVTLWRYAKKSSTDKNIDIAKSARVIAKNQNGNDIILSYILNTSGKKADDISTGDRYKEVIKFDKTTVPNLADTYELPKYDEEGNEYIYFVMESAENEDGNYYYDSVYDKIDEDITTEGIIDNGGTITSTRKGKISVRIDKTWNVASAINDIDGASIRFKIMGRCPESNQFSEITPIEGTPVISGFGVSKTKGSVEVLINPLYSNGKAYEEIIVIEDNIMAGGESIRLTYSNYNKTKLTFAIKGKAKVLDNEGNVTGYETVNNQYKGVSGSLEESGLSQKYGNGIEMWSCEIDNTITTYKEFTFKTIWEGGLKPVTQTTTLEGTSIKGGSTQILTITMDPSTVKKDEVTGLHKGTATISKRLPDGSIKNMVCEFIQIGDDDKGYTWNIPSVPEMEQYDKHGYLYEYKIIDVEPGSSNDWFTSKGSNDDGATVNNLTKDTPGDFININKIWLDDGDVDNRYPIKVEMSVPLTRITPSPTPTPVVTPEPTVEVTAAPTTEAPTGTVGPTVEVTVEPTTEAPTATADEVNYEFEDGHVYDFSQEVTAFGFWRSMYIFSRDDFPYTMDYGRLTIKEVMLDTSDDSKQYESIKESSSIDSVGNGTECHRIKTDKYDYDVKINREVMRGQFSKDKNVVNITITNTRVEKVDIQIKKVWVDGNNYENCRPKKVEFKLYEMIGDETPDIISFGPGVSDGKGEFNVSEDADGICTWTYTLKDMPKYDENGVMYDYYVSDLPKLYMGSDQVIATYEDAKYSGTLSYDYINKKDMNSVHEYTCTSTRKDKMDFVIYQKWLDAALTIRPDMYFSLHRRVKGSAGPEAPTDTLIDSYASQVWEEGTVGGDYNWKIKFENLDKFNALGQEYEYYVVASINNANNSGVGRSYTISYKNSEQYTDRTDKDKKAYLGCTIENLLNDTIEVKGEKIWKNIAGFRLEELPVPIITLYRRLESEEATYDGKDDPHYMNTIELKDGATNFSFSEDYKGDKLHKYNNQGKAYIYYLKENDEQIATSGNCGEGYLYEAQYANNSIVNKFNITTNTRSIIVTKKWDMTNVLEEEEDYVQYPEVKINLYRYKGVLPDGTEEKPTSTSKMELVDSKTITSKELKDTNASDKVIKFEDLLIYSPRGDRYHYYVEEKKINGYSVSYEGDTNTEPNGSKGIYIRDIKNIIGTSGTEEDNITNVEIMNTYNPGGANTVKGVIAWNDYSNYYKLRPSSVDLKLYRYTNSQTGTSNGISKYPVPFVNENTEGLNTSSQRYISWSNTTSNNWNYEIHNLAQYAPNGQQYIYFVEEDISPINAYYKNSGSVSGGIYTNNVVTVGTITNSFSGTYEVKKHWIDGDNKYGFRPKSVTIKVQRRTTDSTIWEDVMDPTNPSNVLTKVLTATNVVPNTKGNTWSWLFTNLPSSIKVDNNTKTVEYRCVETHIGNIAFREGSNEIGAYVMTELSNDNNMTEIVNSMRTTDITINVNWDDVKNYYQTRFGKLYVKLEQTDQVEGKHPDASTEWTQVTDIDGKPIVFEINSSNATTDANGNTAWKKKFDSLPVARVGADSEAASVAIYYRAVICTVQDSYYKHPQNVSVVKSGASYNINASKTYHNYDDVSKYNTTAWSYSTDSKANYMNLDLRMITNEIANEDDSKNRVYLVEAEKKWCKDDTAYYYVVDIELRKSNNGGVSYTSYPRKLVKRIEKDGPSVSWMEMPAYDEDGKDMSYKLYEITTDAWYKCHTDIVTSDAGLGKMDKYTFTNVQQLDYTMRKIWSKNDRVLPTNIGQFRAKLKLQQKIGDDGTWEDSLDDNGVLREREMYVNNRNYASTSSTVYYKIPKYTLDNKRIYYRAVETKVNNIDQPLNVAYTMSNPDLEEGGTVYSDNNNTEVTNTLRTVSLNITMNWDDDNNHDNVRPTTSQTNKFNIDVYADYGSGYVKLAPSFYKLKWDASTANVWKATLVNMPKYTYDGKTMIKYKVVQSVVPTRYFVTETPDIPTFDDATDEYDYSLSNTLNLLVKLKKYDAVNSKGLQGTKFTLYKREYNEQGYVDNAIKNMTADINGNISFEVQELGLYRLVETEAVRGYVDKLDIYGEPDYEDGRFFECAFNVNNENLRQTVNINNTNSVEGRGIYESQSATASEPTLKPAAAVVPEIGVNSGWGSLITANGLVNKRKLGELSFSKQDDVTKTMLDGVTFELYKYANEDGTGAKVYVGDIITGNDYVCSTSGTLTVSSTGKNSEKGNVHISKLPWGKYTLKEVKALPGYALPTSEYSFVVNASTVNDTTHLNENIYIQYNGKLMTNNVLPNIKTRFDFKKLGLDNKQLKGGSFKIVSNDKDRITQSFWNIITDDVSLRVNDLKPNVTVYGLPVGSYRIIETDAPYGYKYTSDVVFSIDQHGNIKNSTGIILGDKVVKMVDESMDIKIINVDEDFTTPISGSTFEITGRFATNYGSEVTDVETRKCRITSLEWFIRENIIPTVENRPSNIYKLKQTKVPAGYEDQPQAVYFIVDENYNIVLTDENGSKPSDELQEVYNLFVKTDNTGVPSIIFENLRIPKNDIYILNGEDYVDEIGNVLCKVFYAYDTTNDVVKLGEPIKFFIDKSNLGLLDFAITTSTNVKDTSCYVKSQYIKIYDSDGNKVEAVNDKYNLKENVEYEMYIDETFLEDLETGSKTLYFYSHMPRKDDVEEVYIGRRTAFPRY